MELENNTVKLTDMEVEVSGLSREFSISDAPQISEDLIRRAEELRAEAGRLSLSPFTGDKTEAQKLNSQGSILYIMSLQLLRRCDITSYSSLGIEQFEKILKDNSL
jgi:hypothetical protein